MATPQTTTRKRQRALEDDAPDAAPRIKARKTHNKTSAEDPPWRYPPEFWDRLSTIPLIHKAVAELNRRNRQQYTRYWPARPSLVSSTCHPDLSLCRFARHGGPDLSDLRGYPPPPAEASPPHAASAMGRSSSSAPSRSRATKSTKSTKPTDPTTATTKKTSAYDRGFEQHLTDHGIHAIPNSQRLDTTYLQETLAARRPSLSPSRFREGDFQAFCNAHDAAKDEYDVCKNVLPAITGPWQPHNYPSTEDVVYGNLEPLTDGTITRPKPDIALGANPTQLNPAIRNDLQHHIVPSTASDRIVAPNFFLEAKGPQGNTSVMQLQARYDGAVGARGMHSLQNHGREEPIYDGRPYTYSSTYHNGTLQMYTHHTTAPSTSAGQPEYHMNRIRQYSMLDTRDRFVEGATAYRNLRDSAKQHRDTFIEEANSRYQSRTAMHNNHNSDEYADHETFDTAQAVDDSPYADERNHGQSEHGQAFQYNTAPMADTASVPMSLPSGSTYTGPTASSKRQRSPNSPPFNPHREKRSQRKW